MIRSFAPFALNRGYFVGGRTDLCYELLDFVMEIAVFNLRLPRVRITSAAVCLAASVVLASGASIGTGFAQTPAPLSAIAQQVASFKANPQQFLSQYPNGGPEMISRAREFAVTDPTVLDALIGLLANANKDQKAAIAAGLGQAAQIVVRTDQPYATRIAQAIANTKDQDVVLAYAGATGDVGVGATGGGGAGSAGASGGQTNSLSTGGTGGGSPEGINGSSTNTGAFSFTSSVSGFGSNTTGTTTTPSTTANLSVTVSP